MLYYCWVNSIKKELGFDPETASTTQILEMLERFLNLNKMKTKLF